jgi:hypothetical protein
MRFQENGKNETKSALVKHPLQMLTLTSLLGVGLALPAAAITVEFTASNVTVAQGLGGGGAQENPIRDDSDNSVVEYLDADNGGGPDWSTNGFVQGDANQAWLRDISADASATSTIASTGVTVHLAADSNDGRAEIFVDSVSKAILDMYDAGGNQVQVIIEGLSQATHTIKVDDLGISTHGGSGDDVALWGASVHGGIHIESCNSNVSLLYDLSNAESENPSTVDGYSVTEWRDADNQGLPDWTANGTVHGDSDQAWLRDAGADITTTTQVPSEVVSVHLQGDNNDGRADIIVDATTVCTLDMYNAPGGYNIAVIVSGLSNSVHTIKVDDIGASTHGGSGNDVAVWGAAALGPAPVPALTVWGTVGLLGALILVTWRFGRTRATR